MSFSANAGFPLTADGFVNVTGEYSTSDITSRGNVRGRMRRQVAGIVGSDLVPLGGLGQRWGDPDVEALKFLVNAGVNLSETLEMYGFAQLHGQHDAVRFLLSQPGSRRPGGATAVAGELNAADRCERQTVCRIPRRQRWSAASSRRG